jgi:hypothetical protein
MEKAIILFLGLWVCIELFERKVTKYDFPEELIPLLKDTKDTVDIITYYDSNSNTIIFRFKKL